MKRIVILGAGSAGIMAANRLRKTFRRKSLDIIIIDKNHEHVYQPGFTLLAFHLEKPENLTRPLKKLLAPGIKLIIDEIVGVTPDNRKVRTAAHGDISYDFLVISTGCRLDPSPVEGLRESLAANNDVHSFYTMPGAMALGNALKKVDGGTVISSICRMPVKCPAASLKFILLAEDFLRDRGIRQRFEFIFTTPLASIVFPREPFGTALARIFRERGIKVVTDFTPTLLDHEKNFLMDSRGKKIHFQLAAICPPHTGSSAMLNSPVITDEHGWVKCDKKHMNIPEYKNIHVIGDAGDLPVPKTASGAGKQVEVLVERIKDAMRGLEPRAVYDGEIICPIPTRHGKSMVVHFNYNKSLGTAVESSLHWNVMINMLRPLYFNLVLPGMV